MPRPQRITYPGAMYYITNQTEGRKLIFRKDEDKQYFLDLLAEISEEFKIKVLAYCLLPNTYHLIIQTTKANLSEALRSVNGIYTQNYNRKYKKQDNLFKGRYKAILFGEADYLTELTKYLHLAPTRQKKPESINQFKDSSYPSYSGKSKAHSCLVTEDILNEYAKTAKTASNRLVKAHAEEVSPELLHKLNPRKWPSILGSDKFVAKAKTKLEKIKAKRK